MTETPTIDLELADGTFRFALPQDAQMNIERYCGAPFGAVAARIMRGRFSIDETSTGGLITQAEFGALDFDMVIRESMVAGGWASSPQHKGYAFNRGDYDTWFRSQHMNKWTIEQKWTVAAAVIGAMFYGQPPATNLPKVAPEAPNAPVEEEAA